ncbi:MAG TPA: 16S rRNA (cytosine(1402)-N(4))-methyltransferase RsmH [Planctomycetaceae bacterium]|nr:16S rRNA (cytosine(1402)-N(4))-methyltransferase RsmH [Planctomycetaceae bacterium]
MAMSDPSDRSSGPVRSVHVPVLLREVLHTLDLKPGLTVVDGTVGAAGHSREILRRMGPESTLIGLDRDPLMLQIAARHLSGPRVHLLQASYAELPRILHELQIAAVDRILLDLGLSSDQLADESRGFSFESEGPLDLRFDVRQGESAADLLSRIGEAELADIIHRFGEDPHSRQVARNIVAWRARQPIRTGRDLAQAVSGAGRRPPPRGARHPATRVFQALRIAVNHELQQLETVLGGALYDCLTPGGIVAVISFHSLEDRLVKHAFRESTQWQLLSPKPVVPSPAEQRLNPRARSAKLRAARKIC